MHPLSRKPGWDKRYRDLLHSGFRGRPAPFLLEVLPLLPPGRALDLACGLGETALLLAHRGYDVLAVDSSRVAVEELRRRAAELDLRLEARVEDLTAWEIPFRSFDVVTCFYYLDRGLFRHIKEALRPGGAVVYETYTTEQLRFGPPRNAAHLLLPGELPRHFADLSIVRYREEILEGPKAVASILAVNEKLPGSGGPS